MQKIFQEVNSLDKRAYKKFLLNEDILMEHAASYMASFIEKKYSNKKSILIVCGPGNNGADGIALARLLYKKFKVKLYLTNEVKSKMAILQKQRVETLKIKITNKIKKADIIVDCIFGSGLNKDLNENINTIIKKLNSFNTIKIACDIPSGINNLGQVSKEAFIADYTITMGALKHSLFTDTAKKYIGKLKVANLGIQRKVYETSSNDYLLEESDLKLPIREQKDSHKGSFGHLNIIAGCKEGAAIISANAGFAFGSGLVTIVSHEKINAPSHIMQSHFLSKNCTAIGIGMGLGKFDEKEIKNILSSNIPKVIDADLFNEKILLDFLNQEIILTPHPKEFISILKISEIANISVNELQMNRIKYVKLFCEKYPKITLLLKGANVIIYSNKKTYINTYGTSALSKGGSGDVLTGLIASLLAQGYSNTEACVNASLAHALASKNYKNNNYSLCPNSLIEEVKKL